jgi:hypothetical protein
MIYLLIISLFTSLFFANNTHAMDEFSIKNNLSYEVNQTGDANVTQKIELINNFSEIYPTEYKINITGSNIQDISAHDSLGNILTRTETVDDNHIIYLKFNEENIGKNQKTIFNIRYLIKNFAENKGKTWEIKLPEYQNTQNNININLLIPESFGRLSFSSIPRPQLTKISDKTQIQLNQNQIINKKILFTFGNYQLFDFDLKYYLSNKQNKQIKTSIPIPPDNDSQKIIIQKIEPQPQNIEIDDDGNWLAKYILQPNEEIIISVIGQAKIIGYTIAEENLDTDQLTQEQTYWPSNDSNIIQIANNLKTIKDVYNYVVNTLSYNYDIIDQSQRKGALDALLSPNKALCTEFTDLFITLLRAKGIPAREIQGFAYTNNPKIKPTNITADILHAWPQYYDKNKKMWISVDPTWENTTKGIDYFNELDFNHFIFVIHGHNSIYPSPAGSYKNNQDIKTIDVKFATQEIQTTNYSLKINTDNNNLIINNPNNYHITNLNLSLKSINWHQNFDILPANGTITTKLPNLPFLKSIFSKNQKINITVDYNNSNQPSSHEINYLPHYKNLIIIISITIVILATAGILLTLPKKK